MHVPNSLHLRYQEIEPAATSAIVWDVSVADIAVVVDAIVISQKMVLLLLLILRGDRVGIDPTATADHNFCRLRNRLKHHLIAFGAGTVLDWYAGGTVAGASPLIHRWRWLSRIRITIPSLPRALLLLLLLVVVGVGIVTR
jgi:hypothetical protein